MPRSSLPQKETFLFQTPSVTSSFLCRCPAVCPRAAAGSSGSPGFPVPPAHLRARTEPPRPQPRNAELWGISDSTPPTLPTSSKGNEDSTEQGQNASCLSRSAEKLGDFCGNPSPKARPPHAVPVAQGPCREGSPPPAELPRPASRPSSSAREAARRLLCPLLPPI